MPAPWRIVDFFNSPTVTYYVRNRRYAGDPVWDDCNRNGIPDGCDIASGISGDLDQNGIPDECETGGGEGAGGGGGDGTGGGGAAAGGGPSEPTAGSALDPDEAWTEFYLWSLSQPWGPDSPHTGSQQFQRMIDKLRELGLPLESPTW